MAIGKTSASRLSLYLIYAVFLTIALLLVRFPKEKFLTYVEKKIEVSFPEYKVKLSTLSYMFPFSAHLDRAQMTQVRGAEEVLFLQDVRITPKLSGFGFAYDMTGSVLGGSFSTELKLDREEERYSLYGLNLSGVDLNRSTYLARIFRRELQGILTFKGDYSAPLGGSAKGGKGMDCEGVLRVEGGSFALRQPVLTLKTMDFASMGAVLTSQSGVVTFSEGVLEGLELKADFGGTLGVANTPQSWRLNIEGAIAPSAEFLQKNPQMVGVVQRLLKQYKRDALPYTIKGTIANPRFRFGVKN